jgi:hypothetical protein
VPVRLESDIETRVCKQAEQEGWWALKLVCMGHRGFPDRWFICGDEEYGPRIVIIEFKAPGKRARKLQRWVCDRLTRMGFEVHLDIDDYEQAMAILRATA